MNWKIENTYKIYCINQTNIYSNERNHAKNKKTEIMNKIRIAITSNNRILAIPYPSAKMGLLNLDEEILREWFYNKPRQLESFLNENPEMEELFPKAFAYWVICKAMGTEENQNSYGLLKRKMSEFSGRLFRAVRSLAGRIADQIKVFTGKTTKKQKGRYTNRQKIHRNIN